MTIQGLRTKPIVWPLWVGNDISTIRRERQEYLGQRTTLSSAGPGRDSAGREPLKSTLPVVVPSSTCRRYCCSQFLSQRPSSRDELDAT